MKPPSMAEISKSSATYTFGTVVGGEGILLVRVEHPMCAMSRLSTVSEHRS
jgi:hypothetical protein